MQQEEFSSRLKAYMRMHSHTQKTLSAAAGISQSTISRLLDGSPVRNGRAFLRLCNYMQQAASGKISSPDSLNKVINAFHEIWDNTDAHASAIAELIIATRKLRPIQDEPNEL